MKVIELLVPCYNEEVVLMKASAVQLTSQAKQKWQEKNPCFPPKKIPLPNCHCCIAFEYNRFLTETNIIYR